MVSEVVRARRSRETVPENMKRGKIAQKAKAAGDYDLPLASNLLVNETVGKYRRANTVVWAAKRKARTLFWPRSHQPRPLCATRSGPTQRAKEQHTQTAASTFQFEKTRGHQLSSSTVLPSPPTWSKEKKRSWRADDGRLDQVADAAGEPLGCDEWRSDVSPGVDSAGDAVMDEVGSGQESDYLPSLDSRDEARLIAFWARVMADIASAAQFEPPTLRHLFQHGGVFVDAS